MKDDLKLYLPLGGFYSNLTLSSLPIYIFAPLMGGVMSGCFQLLNGKVDKIMKEAAAAE